MKQCKKCKKMFSTNEIEMNLGLCNECYGEILEIIEKV